LACQLSGANGVEWRGAALTGCQFRGRETAGGVECGLDVCGPQLVEQIERATNPGDAALHDVGINHGGGHVLVAEQLLDRPDVVSLFQQVGGEAVAPSSD
jgi:hypothetical protein